ncbi:ArsR/SmtB family transcription factor [Dyella lutea]|uniref:Metalloregulator ArsR/SmtB family transcription factor n=1 Tax=Dyella lutea TaxID=2950441 RepID=A0ABT1FAY9_9GAMM|nr:metalloregulator ArsR/SmtB family transcription factor [Dyella lutea]MCP1374541.1 metalloregulator ArsR/SmtB family transcription factor [Dyella lutea]
MDESIALDTLAALAQSTRLAVFRLLVSHEPHGLPAGDVAAALDVPQNTLSAHLAVLARAGLVEGERQGRSIVYRARLDALRALMVYLARDCCSAHPELCQPLLAELACCPPAKASR